MLMLAGLKPGAYTACCLRLAVSNDAGRWAQRCLHVVGGLAPRPMFVQVASGSAQAKAYAIYIGKDDCRSMDE